MADLLELSKQYHRIVSDRLQSSGLSPEQLAVHSRILELAEQATDDNDLEEKKSAENLTYKLSQGLSVDNWMAKVKAAQEAGDEKSVQVFTATAEAARQATDHNSLAAAVEDKSSAGMQDLTHQESVKNSLIEAVHAVFRYRIAATANTDRRAKLIGDLKIHVSALAEKEQKFEDLVNDQYYRDFVPLSDDQWTEILKVYQAMDKPETDSDAQAKLAEETKTVHQQLQDKSQLMKEIQDEIERKGTRKACLGIAPDDAPGPYRFKLIWEGGRNE
jgi:hypothetical protein